MLFSFFTSLRITGVHLQLAGVALLICSALAVPALNALSFFTSSHVIRVYLQLPGVTLLIHSTQQLSFVSLLQVS